jgi:predicted small secreted protein
MWRTRLLLVLLLPVAIVVTACNFRSIKGSGDLITETIEVSNIDGVSLSGIGTVIITQGEGESLSIETDDNVMEHIEVEVDGRTLKLGFKNGFNAISPTQLTFNVGVDVLSSLAVSGSGDIESGALETDRLEVKVSGSGHVQIADLNAEMVNAEISGVGDINLSGDTALQEVDISGAGNYLAGDLCSESVKVSISGSGNATVCATETLDSNSSGSGKINNLGDA